MNNIEIYNMEDIIDIHLNGQLYLYMSNTIKNKYYDIYYSDLIDDQYWNFAYLKNKDIPLNDIFDEIKSNMNKLNRNPIIYITSNIIDSKLQENIKNSNLKLLYTDVWMTLDNLERFESYKSKIDFSVYKVDEKLKEQFIQAIMDGFSGDNPEEPYESLSDGYKIALEKSFNENNSEYKVIHYLGKTEKEAITTATVVYKKDKAVIYNVTTNKKYQRNGVCKQMMSDIVKDLVKLNINEVCVQTEQGFYTEQVYKNMGFKEVMLGKAYIEKAEE